MTPPTPAEMSYTTCPDAEPIARLVFCRGIVAERDRVVAALRVELAADPDAAPVIERILRTVLGVAP